MASFIAKQLVGKQINAVKGAVGGGDDKKDDDDKKTNEDGEDLEVAEARREEEERRREKHRKAEEEREEIRAQIRKKYNIKKREDFPMMEDPNRQGQIGRKRKTPEELAAEARGESIEEDSGFLPANISEMQAKLTEGPGQLLAGAQEKCSLM
ncbi:complexin-like isoform X1 [Watersipora subatra]|uniref:complexin-like isoform X1 n=1 Tax=Watersipora subatra TaxID=2589382 RepID=UPI00355C69EA